MPKNPKFSVGLWALDGTSDRFCRQGYSESLPLKELIQNAAKVPGCRAVECHQTDFNNVSVKQYVKIMSDNGLVTSNVNTNVWADAVFKHGAFTHRDKSIRTRALDEGKRSVDIAREIGSPGAALWLGSDGSDYPFQVDFTEQWDLIVDGIGQMGEYAAPDIRIGVEYKLKEPRNHMTIGSMGKALVICLELGMDNVGVTVDFGHALMSKESPAESVACLARHGKLFNVHFNDAYREWDDDMIPGTVHVWETLEFLYYCRKTGYDGWYGLDMFPYREDGLAACTMAIKNLRDMLKLVDKLNESALRRAQRSMDAIASQKVVRRMIYG